ncbi:MAG: hypothetical protein IIB09_08000, partial [Bacteroidetes bacterium]|nr:hypothetical protein [Bacteroidota bacterium]
MTTVRAAVEAGEHCLLISARPQAALIALGAEVGFNLVLELTFTTALDLDLGVEAEALNLSFGSSIDVSAGLRFAVAFGVDLTDGSIDNNDFFVRPGTLTVFASAGIADLDISLDIGFLSAAIDNGSVSLVAEAEVTFEDPSNPIALGFEDSQRGTSSDGTGNFTADTVITDFELDHDV